MIYLSFGLWIASNNSVYINVIAYFLGAKKALSIVVLMIQNIYRNHSGKNQEKRIIPIIDKYALKEKLGYFITNNASCNNKCAATIIDLIWPDLDLWEWRL